MTNPYLDQTAKALTGVMNQMKFGEDVVDVFERSKSDWNLMIEKISSETEAIKSYATTTLSPSASPPTLMSKGSIGTSSSYANKQSPSCNYEVNSWKDAVADHWLKAYSATTETGDYTGKEEDEYEFLKAPMCGAGKWNCNIQELSSLRRRQEQSGSNEQLSLDGFVGDDAPACVRRGFMTVRQSVESVVAEAKKVNPRDVLSSFDCSQRFEDVQEPQELQLLPRQNPLNHSWFSFEENDSISKLTIPLDLSTSLNNTLNGLNLSRDLTEIPKVEENIDDNVEDSIYMF
jgi:hypothetical protein